MYSALAAVVLAAHLLFILWIIFGAAFTRQQPLLRWLHLGSLVWGILIEILPWTCPLTWAENWLETRAGRAPYQGGFLLHYLDALVYPNISPALLTGLGVAVCVVNLSIYARRFRRRSAGKEVPGVSGHSKVSCRMAKKNRMPKKGDLVTALGHTGTFEVVGVDSQNRVVDLRSLEKRNVPLADTLS